MATSRRSFLRGLGAGALSLPLANLARRSVARAQDAPGAEQPLRLLLFTPHGTAHELWRPHATADGGWDISFPGSILAPLAAFKDKLVVLDGVDFRVLWEHGGTGHEGAPCTLWTGSRRLDKDGSHYPESASIDQVLAGELGQTTALPSLELGVNEPGGGLYETFSFGPGGARVPHMNNPVKVFERVFGDIVPDAEPEAALKVLARRQSLLDFLDADVLRLKGRLAGEERLKIEAHEDAIRALEQKLTATVSSCVIPEEPYFTGEGWLDDKWVREDAHIPAITELQMDLLVEAFRCDQTRFATLNLTKAGSHTSMPWIGYEGGIHNEVAHTYHPDDAEAVERLADVQRWYATQLAYLLERMDAIDEGDGTMLDNTLIVWGNELGNPASHHPVNVPFVVAGGGGKSIPLGRHLELSLSSSAYCYSCPEGEKFSTQTAHNGLLVGLMHAFGFTDVQTFGHPDYVGVLPGLLG